MKLTHGKNVNLILDTHSKNSHRLLHAALCGLLHSSPGAQCGHNGQQQHAADHAGPRYQNWRFREKPEKKNAFENLWRTHQWQRYFFFSGDEISSSHVRNNMEMRHFISFILKFTVLVLWGDNLVRKTLALQARDWRLDNWSYTKLADMGPLKNPNTLERWDSPEPVS